MDTDLRPTEAATTVTARTVQAGTDALAHGGGLSVSRLLPFLGPAFIASVAYMDPGNFATNIQGGAQFGYMLLWVVVVSNLMAMLIMAASTFFKQGMHSVGTLEEAHRTLEPLLGRAASIVFALSLLAAGLASSSVGTMAGQVVMPGFMRRHIPVSIRRLATILPSLVVIFIGFDPTRTLVLSQVVLSFGTSYERAINVRLIVGGHPFEKGDPPNPLPKLF